MGRSFCYRCHKAGAQCICDLIVEVQNQLPVHILQHFRERFHPIGTARMARLGLQNCQVSVAQSRFPKNGAHRQPGALLTPINVPDGTAVLYPSKKAVPLSRAPKPSAVLLIDATWSHAKRLYFDNPWIHELDHVALEPTEPSRYLIRKEPALHCLSTLEAIVMALQAWEPELKGLEGLLKAFDLMIARQSQYI